MILHNIIQRLSLFNLKPFSLTKNKFSLFFFLLSFFFLIPIFTILYLVCTSQENIWPHLFETVFPVYFLNSLALMVGVAFFSFIFGVTSAWSITRFDFPTKKILSWAIFLPFAFPAYIIFYVYTDFLEYSGPVQVFLREVFQWSNQSEYWFPEIRSLLGAIILFSLVFYPYVYLMSRSAFLEQSQSVLESAEMLGLNRWQTFYRISLPLARPAIVVGIILLMMETLSDFGAVEFFSISTLSLGVYNVWINMSNLGGASQIAFFCLVMIFFLIALERVQRKHQKQVQTENSVKKILPLTGLKMVLALIFNWGLIFAGFLIPLGVLLNYAIQEYKEVSFQELFTLIQNSFFLASFTAVMAVALGLFVVYYIRFHCSIVIKMFSKFFYLNYAIPGTIMAIGIMIPFNFLFSALLEETEKYIRLGTGIFTFFSLTILFLAYLLRFTPISIGSIDSAFKKISPNLDASASLLGMSNLKVFFHIHRPLIRKAILTAALIVFMDTMKELPMTLILRPFNFDTLATNVYSFANNELIEKAAFSSLFIVFIGIFPSIWLSKNISKND